MPFLHSVLLWCQALHAFEQSAEVGNIFESAFVADLLDGQRCVVKQMAGNRQTVLVEKGDDGFARMMLEEGTECRTVHAYMLSKVIDGDIAFVVATDVNFNLFQPTLGICLCLFSNLHAFIADGNNAEQVDELRQPLCICQMRHQHQTFRQSLSCPSCEDNGLYRFRKASKVCLQLWECGCYCVNQFWGERYSDVFYLLPIVIKQPTMGCLWRHKYHLAALERFTYAGNSPDTLALNNQREFPCRLLMDTNLL